MISAAPLVECVPNFSEGRDQRTIDALRAAVSDIPGVQLLDVQTDAAHNRSVLTMVGDPEATGNAAFAAMRVARERIDLTKRSGVHPTAGATAIGARPFLVAFNVYLDTQDIAIAKEIAKQIRTSSGGLPGVQASGFIVDGLAQVSMNLLDIDITSPAVVFNAIKARAEKQGVGVQYSEIVGLIPERALVGAAESLLRLSNAGNHILETKIRAAMPAAIPSAGGGRGGPSLDGWIDELAGGAPTPGGGSAAARAGTPAASLVAMVARLTIGKKAYADVETQARDILAEAEQLRGELRRLVDEDAAAYAGVRQAYKIPKADPHRAQAIDDALLAAARPPADVVKRGRRLLALAQTIEHIGNKNAVSDARVAGMLARTAIDGATENVNANLAGMSDGARAKQAGAG